MTLLPDLVAPFLIDGPGLEVRDPADRSFLGTVRAYDAETAGRAVLGAQGAMPGWAGRTAKERSAVLRRWFELIRDHADELALLCTLESGKPLAESRGEVAYAASFVEWFAEEAKRVYGDLIPETTPGSRILVLKQPVGVAAAITPWNFPLAMITRKAAPALAVGCPMVVKPAEATPLSALALERLAHLAGVPEPVFRVLPTTDPAALGGLFCDSLTVRKLSFTGSTPVGKLLMARAAGTVKRLSLELGGNAPFIVFDDADLDAAVAGAMASKFRNAGQTCVCANRFLVQQGIHDAFIDKLATAVAGLRVGHGREPGTTLGPLITPAAAARVERLVADALADGARAVIGGGRVAGTESFFQATVLDRATPDMAVTRQEIFGPVAPVMTFRDEAEAVRLANDTPAGLAAYLYAGDRGRIWRVMEALEYGMVGVNSGLMSTEVAPFGGVKESGLGRESSRYGVDEYLELKYCLLGAIAR